MFQEFPKGLCRGGVHGEWRIVHDDGQEQEARSDGFAHAHEWQAPQEPAQRKKPGPKPKQ